jgi:hypothetical protein
MAVGHPSWVRHFRSPACLDGDRHPLVEHREIDDHPIEVITNDLTSLQWHRRSSVPNGSPPFVLQAAGVSGRLEICEASRLLFTQSDRLDDEACAAWFPFAPTFHGACLDRWFCRSSALLHRPTLVFYGGKRESSHAARLPLRTPPKPKNPAFPARYAAPK